MTDDGVVFVPRGPGRGPGGRLLDALEAAARGLGYDRVRLDSHEESARPVAPTGCSQNRLNHGRNRLDNSSNGFEGVVHEHRTAGDGGRPRRGLTAHGHATAERIRGLRHRRVRWRALPRSASACGTARAISPPISSTSRCSRRSSSSASSSRFVSREGTTSVRSARRRRSCSPCCSWRVRPRR